MRFFGQHGIPRSEVLLDAIKVAASPIPHDFVHDGPHVVSPPIAVTGAQPGDILRIDIVTLTPRVPYGVTSIRHGKGALPEIFPQTPPSAPGASAARPDLYHNVSIVIPIRNSGMGWVGLLPTHSGSAIPVPLHPFLGVMGVAANTLNRVPSVPPSTYGGNLDIQDLTAGSTLYLPVEVPGALFYVSDSHFSQGNGEVDLTAIEGSLRATVRLTVIKRGTPGAPFGGHLQGPFAESARAWYPIGLSPDLNEAMRGAVTQGVEFLADRFEMTPTEAYAYLSVGANFDVSEVVDATKGIHGIILKSDFATVPRTIPGRRSVPMERTVPVEKSRISPSVSRPSSTN